MAGLIKAFPPRSTKQSDSAAVKKASRVQTVTATVKGGKGLLEQITTAVAVVQSRLGKYADQYLLLRDEKEVRDYFAKVREIGKGAIDTETSSLDPITCTLAGVCLYADGLKPAYVPMHHQSYITNVEFNAQIPDHVIAEEITLCEASGVQWDMHNANFDCRVVKHQLGVPITCSWDTSLAARCLNENESSFKLKDLYPKYVDPSDRESLTYESLFENIPFTLVPISTGYLYAAGDPYKTAKLADFQRQYLNRRKLPGPYNVFRTLEMPLVPVITDMEDEGVDLDLDFVQELSNKYHAQLEEREAEFFKVLEMYAEEINVYKRSNPNHKLSDPVNINSPTQIAILLYDVLQLKSPDKEKPRGTGVNILKLLDTPLSKSILAVRETSKLLSTYIDKMPQVVNPKTGKIHCHFNQYGAATGRFSSSEPNMQNIPAKNKEIRKMFIAGNGCALISCDFSQQEPRTLAHVSKDAALIQAYRDGKDIYAWIASSIYGVPYEECKEHHLDGTENSAGKKRRDSVKSIILGIMYSRGAKAIGEQLGIPTKEAQKIIDKFFDTYPDVKKFIDETVKKAHLVGYVETVWGRKRRLPDMLLEEYEFTYDGGISPDFDPLDFTARADEEPQVPDSVKRNFVARLRNTRSRKEKANIYIQAKQQGITIKDNGGLIARAMRQCVNSIIQGSAADMIKRAMIEIHKNDQLKKLGYTLVLQVHDEIIGRAPLENAKRCGELVAHIMATVAAEKIDVPMKVDVEITDRWYGKEPDWAAFEWEDMEDVG